MKNKKRLWGSLAGVVVVLAVLAVVVGQLTQQKQNNATRKPVVAVSLDFYGEMARTVGGKHAVVQTAISSTKIDPHDYEPTPSVAKKYAGAAIIVSNGAGYDTWSTQFAKQNKKATAVTVANLVGYKPGENEHLWFKPGAATKLVQAMARTLSQQNPKDKQYYHERANRYLAKLATLTQAQQDAKAKLKNVRYLATEPVYDNTLQQLGASEALPDFAEAVEEENDPTTGDIQQWHTLIQKHQVAFVINNPQNSSRVVKQAVAYAKKHNIPVINVTETKPAGETYIQWQKQTLAKVLASLK